jgi:hypothetical protein
MSHWYVQDRLGHEHRADLDREATRASLSKAVRAGARANRRSGVLAAAMTLISRLRARPVPGAGQVVDRPMVTAEGEA